MNATRWFRHGRTPVEGAEVIVILGGGAEYRAKVDGDSFRFGAGNTIRHGIPAENCAAPIAWRYTPEYLATNPWAEMRS